MKKNFFEKSQLFWDVTQFLTRIFTQKILLFYTKFENLENNFFLEQKLV